MFRPPAAPTLAATLLGALALLALRPAAPSPAPSREATPTGAASPTPIPTPPPTPPSPVTVLPLDAASTTRAPHPATSAFLDWSARYLAVPAPDAAARSTLLPEGLALARARRATLADLIRQDPEAALASALPRHLVPLLPVELAPELETFLSARAPLEIIQVCLHPPGIAHDHADDLYRATVIEDREYRVHTFGSRLRDASLPASSPHGIALDGHAAISPARHRILSAAEIASTGLALPSPEALAVEADGNITILPSPDALPAFTAALRAAEQNPVVPAPLDAADSGSGSSGVTGRPTQAWTHGAKSLLVIRVDFSDLPGTPINKFDGDAEITPAYIDEVIHGANGVRAFMQENSFGKADIDFDPATDVTPVLRLPDTASSYATAEANSLLHSHARAAALSAGYDSDAYDRVAVVFSNLGSLTDSQITYGGLGNIIGPNLWINGAFDLRVVAHELGHNHGLRHSNLWQVADGNPVSAAGSSTEYGDPFDLMGDGDFFENHFSHWNKSLLQWIPDSAVALASASGTYRVSRLDASAADLSAPRALKIVRDSTRDYWIGYRRGTSSIFADNGAYVLWGYNSNQQGNLLDLVTPGTNAANAPLPLNTSFQDGVAGITLRPLAQGGSGPDEWLDLQVTLQPRIQWAATSYVANEQGGSIALSVTRSANSTGNVSVSYATSSGSATSPADFAAGSGTLSWPDGDLTPRTITVPLVADALVEGTETFTVTLHSPSGGVLIAPSDATVTIAEPGARDPSFFASNTQSTVNRALPLPDGNIVVAGSFQWIQAADFTVYNYARIARLGSTGAIDPSFDPGTGANGTVHALARQPDGKILLGGDFTSLNGTARNRIARLNTDGSLDTTFDPGAGPDSTVYEILVQPDGRILVGGTFANYAGTARNRLVRLLPDGAIDTGFANPAYSATSSGIRALALQPDGNILVGGGFSYPFGSGGGVGFKSGLTRLLSDGTRDTSFDVGYGAHTSSATNVLSPVYRIAVLPDGRILVGGAFSGFGGLSTPTRSGLARLSASGAVDTTFTVTAAYGPSSLYVQSLLPLPDGSTLIGGQFDQVSGTAASRIARILANGTVDSAFSAAGGFSNPVNDLNLQPDGKVLAAGILSTFQSTPAGLPRPVWRLIPGLPALPGTLQFAADAASGTEGGSATLSVTRSGGSLGALSVGYSTVAGGATAGADYTTTSGTLAWAVGDTSAKTITVPLALDAAADTPETLLVNLGQALLGGALLGERQQATLTIQTAFDAWRAAHFSPAQLATPTISGDEADPDADGLDNLAEFALVRAPLTADAASAWTTELQKIGGTDYLTLTFRRRAPALDLAYSVQSSSTLAGASWTADAVQVGSATPHGDGTETVTYRDSTPAGPGAPRRFLRVEIHRTP